AGPGADRPPHAGRAGNPLPVSPGRLSESLPVSALRSGSQRLFDQVPSSPLTRRLVRELRQGAGSPRAPSRMAILRCPPPPSVVATGAGNSATLGRSVRRLPSVRTRGAAGEVGEGGLVSVRGGMERDPRGG